MVSVVVVSAVAMVSVVVVSVALVSVAMVSNLHVAVAHLRLRERRAARRAHLVVGSGSGYGLGYGLGLGLGFGLGFGLSLGAGLGLGLGRAHLRHLPAARVAARDAAASVEKVGLNTHLDLWCHDTLYAREAGTRAAYAQERPPEASCPAPQVRTVYVQ